MEITVFYSWQSDLDNSTNRSFIEGALEKAINSINKENKFKVKPVIKQGAQDEAGSAHIAETILSTIKKAEIFVADVSIINAATISNNEKPIKPTPNPNVLIELGYAIGTIGWNRILMVMNADSNNPYEKVEVLPFDLRHRNVCTYSLKKGDIDKPEKRKQFEGRIKYKLEQILKDVEQAYVEKENEEPFVKQELEKIEKLRIEEENAKLSERFNHLAQEDNYLLAFLANNKPHYFTAKNIKSNRGGDEGVISYQLGRLHDHGLVEWKQIGQEEIKWGITNLGYRVIKLKGYLT
ncbi:MAG: hypothetical protein FD167_93 [bacterium]|nr:MAG: hypothetical protein FD167_93 [bacterium]